MSRQSCDRCGLAPFKSRDEWALDRERQNVGYQLARVNHEILPTYCMSCGRYQGVRLIGEMAKRWPLERIAALYDYFDGVASHRIEITPEPQSERT